MHILVTGAGGFVGQHLVPLLVQRDHHVIAGVHNQATLFDKEVQTVQLNVMDRDKIIDVMKETKPDVIVHLAAQSNVRVSWEHPLETIQMNTIAAINILEAMKTACPQAKLISVGSSEEYGMFYSNGESITEQSPCIPQNPYAVSKFAAGQILLQKAYKDNLLVIHARPFNHFGPGQKLGFVIADFASQIVQIESGAREPVIRVGNLASQRDFTDVRDIVRAYLLLVENNAAPGVYNISSMIPREIQWILHTLIDNSNVKISIEVDPGKLRPIDIPVYFGSSEKLRQAVNWQPEFEFKQSLMETLEWWRQP
jgi:GDP-4-dehydro-6-deoxy-D-mannose reductase